MKRGEESLIQVEIDEQEIKELALEKIEEKLKEVDQELVFWDRKELMRRTCMSWNFIQEQFFYDERFPKFKIGSKWYFPVRETREFLEKWIREQGRR